MEQKWLTNVENLPDEKIIIYAKGIERRLQDEENVNVRVVMGERLGVLQNEVEKRGLSL